jgi:hypothetical protein
VGHTSYRCISVIQCRWDHESAYVYKSKDVWHTCFASRLHVGHTYQFICGMCGSREIFEMTCCFARADLVWVEDYTQLPYVEHPFGFFSQSIPPRHVLMELYISVQNFTHGIGRGASSRWIKIILPSPCKSQVSIYQYYPVQNYKCNIYSKPNDTKVRKVFFYVTWCIIVARRYTIPFVQIVVLMLTANRIYVFTFYNLFHDINLNS